MNITSSDEKEEIKFQGKYYKIYYSSESKEGRGLCSICGRKKRFFVVNKVIGIEEKYGNEIDKDSDLGKEITEKLKRVLRRENFCDNCDI